MAGHEVTTIMPGDRGAPTLLIREPGWREQAAAEKRRQADEEIKKLLAGIERDRASREHARPPRPPSAVEQVYADCAREDWLAGCRKAQEDELGLPRRQAELEEWARKAELELLRENKRSLAPDRARTQARRDAANAYSADLAEWMAANRPRPGVR